MALVTRVKGKVAKTELGKARERLEDLGFDPVENLVAMHDRLVAEDEYMSSLRHMTMTAVPKDKGGQGFPQVKYSSMVHAAILAQLEKVNSSLLAYGYSKMPTEVDASGTAYEPLIINVLN